MPRTSRDFRKRKHAPSSSSVNSTLLQHRRSALSQHRHHRRLRPVMPSRIPKWAVGQSLAAARISSSIVQVHAAQPVSSTISHDRDHAVAATAPLGFTTPIFSILKPRSAGSSPMQTRGRTLTSWPEAADPGRRVLWASLRVRRSSARRQPRARVVTIGGDGRAARTRPVLPSRSTSGGAHLAYTQTSYRSVLQ